METAIKILAYFVLALLSEDYKVHDRVDLIEHNTFCDDQGSVVFKQWLFWEYTKDSKRLVDWRLDKPGKSVITTYPNPRLMIMESEAFRTIESIHFKQSITQHDPELVDRESWPKEKRRLLKPMTSTLTSLKTVLRP